MERTSCHSTRFERHSPPAQLLKLLRGTFVERDVDAFWHSPLFQMAIALAENRDVDHKEERIPIPGALATSGIGKSRLLYELVNARGLTLPPDVDFAPISVTFTNPTPLTPFEESQSPELCLVWRIVHYVHPELKHLREQLADVLRGITLEQALVYALMKLCPGLETASRRVIVLLAVDEVTRLRPDPVTLSSFIVVLAYSL